MELTPVGNGSGIGSGGGDSGGGRGAASVGEATVAATPALDTTAAICDDDADSKHAKDHTSKGVHEGVSQADVSVREAGGGSSESRAKKAPEKLLHLWDRVAALCVVGVCALGMSTKQKKGSGSRSFNKSPPPPAPPPPVPTKEKKFGLWRFK